MRHDGEPISIKCSVHKLVLVQLVVLVSKKMNGVFSPNLHPFKPANAECNMGVSRQSVGCENKLTKVLRLAACSKCGELETHAASEDLQLISESPTFVNLNSKIDRLA